MSYNIGIICPSEIAFRRFLPSLSRVHDFCFAGVAIATPAEWAGEESQSEQTKAIIRNERAKAQSFIDTYGGHIYDGYQAMIDSPDIDVVYIPLPPAMHFKWAKYALESGKHAYVEKPFTTSLADTQTLISIAREKGLVVHENYMFVFHRQIQTISDIIGSGEIGRVRQYRISFGFPRRAANDFRYNRSLGGGALLDAGGYCIKYGSMLLGKTARIVNAITCQEPEWDVDIFGNATMINDEGVSCQISFGMDCDYKCELEAWGSLGTLTTGRVLTAPDGFEPEVQIKHNQTLHIMKLPADSAFEKSIMRFLECLKNPREREENYTSIETQSLLVEQYYQLL